MTRQSPRYGRVRRAVALVLTGGVLAMCVVPMPIVRADSWRGATIQEVFSRSRDWFVRVVPGKSLGDTVGFAGAAKGPFATAEWYRRQPDRSYRLQQEKPLANPIAPVAFFVTDHGALVTLDNWHNYGYGKVVAIYDAAGQTRRAYELEELFSPEEINRMSHSVSSIQWRTETTYVREDQRSVYIGLDGKGGDLIVATDTGAWQICGPRDGRHQCRTTNTNRKWSGFVDPASKP